MDCASILRYMSTTQTDNQTKTYTITVFTENQIGLFNRISIIFSRRQVSIESINSSPTETKNIFRFGVVVNENIDMVIKLVRQIEKQVEVLKAYYHTDEQIIWQELALYKIPTEVVTEKISVERLLREYGARAVVIRQDYTIFEATGHREDTERLIELLSPYGLIEFVRSARIAIAKMSSGIHEKIIELESANPNKVSNASPVNQNEYPSFSL